MNPDVFDKQMRAMEYFHTLRFLPGAWVIIQVDGRGFSRLTAARFQKPFDPAFRDLMVQTAQALMHDLHALVENQVVLTPRCRDIEACDGTHLGSIHYPGRLQWRQRAVTSQFNQSFQLTVEGIEPKQRLKGG